MLPLDVLLLFLLSQNLDLINDAAVICNKVLVSGAALGLEGQITVYHGLNEKGDLGPCYRCLFPVPPPPETVPSCANAGVLGVVPGIIGNLQALEVLKIAGKFGQPLVGRMVLFDALNISFRNIKLRERVPNCSSCGNNPSIDRNFFSTFSYEFFCASAASDKPSSSIDPANVVSVSAIEYGNRIGRIISHTMDPNEYARLLKDDHILLDVRDQHQFSISSLPHALNIPVEQLQTRLQELIAARRTSELPIFVICRRGIRSVQAVTMLSSLSISNIFNISGGLTSWHRDVDPHFPLY